jgi:hypothetical protein
MDVPTDRGAALLSEVFCRIFLLSFFFILPNSKPEHKRISHISLLSSMNCNTLPSVYSVVKNSLEHGKCEVGYLA